MYSTHEGMSSRAREPDSKKKVHLTKAANEDLVPALLYYMLWDDGQVQTNMLNAMIALVSSCWPLYVALCSRQRGAHNNLPESHITGRS